MRIDTHTHYPFECALPEVAGGGFFCGGGGGRRRAMCDVCLTLGVCILRTFVPFFFFFLQMNLSVYVNSKRGIERERERSVVRLFWPSLMNEGKKKRGDRVCSRGSVGWVCTRWGLCF